MSSLLDLAHAAVRAHDRTALLAACDEMEALHTPEGAALAAYSRGIDAWNEGNYPVALSYYRTALDLYEDLHDTRWIARTSIQIANVYTVVGDYPAALHSYRSALDVFEAAADKQAIANTLTGIGHILNNTGDSAGSLEIYNTAMTLMIELDERTNAAGTHLNISSAMLNLGDVNGAHEHIVTALEMFTELNDQPHVMLAQINLSTTHLRRGELDEARRILYLPASNNIVDPEMRLNRDTSPARLHELDGDLDAANGVLLEALKEARSKGLRAHEVHVCLLLRNLAKHRNDFATYVQYNEEHSALNEEIKGAEATRSMAMVEKQRELDVIQRERDRERTVLHSTLPRDVAERMIRGEVVNDHFENASVIFIDIVGFTTLSAQLSSQEVIAFLDKISTEFDAICATYNVTKIKTIGDSYMAVAFDADGTTSAVNAARAAMDMRNMQYRIGVHSGPATAGVIGKERMQYDVWGDTVNVASRMESTGQAGRVHVSEAFAMNLKSTSEFSIEERGLVDVKGKGMMMTYWLNTEE